MQAVSCMCFSFDFLPCLKSSISGWTHRAQNIHACPHLLVSALHFLTDTLPGGCWQHVAKQLCRDNEALQAFAQDAYHCSLAYGPQDVRTSLAYYNLAKVFQGMQELDKTLVCCDQV